MPRSQRKRRKRRKRVTQLEEARIVQQGKSDNYGIWESSDSEDEYTPVVSSVPVSISE